MKLGKKHHLFLIFKELKRKLEKILYLFNVNCI
jgi:hypothetical protein